MREKVEALILAGGRGSRLENRDKGLVQLQNKTLVEYVVKSIAPQVNQLSISCNRNKRHYQSILDQILNDLLGSSPNAVFEDDKNHKYSGPLAGIARFLPVSSHDYLFICPCDTPFLPDNLVERLLEKLRQSGAQACYPVVGTQKHPLILLVEREPAALTMSRLLSETPLSSTRSPSIREWLTNIDSCELNCSEDSLIWSNINSLEDLERISSLLDQD